MACQHGFDSMVSLLIEHTSLAQLLAKPESIASGTPLHLACKNKVENLKIVETILAKIRAEPDSTASTTLAISPLYVVEKNLTELFRQVDANNQTIFLIAIANNHLSIIEHFFKYYLKYVIDQEDKNG